MSRLHEVIRLGPRCGYGYGCVSPGHAANRQCPLGQAPAPVPRPGAPVKSEKVASPGRRQAWLQIVFYAGQAACSGQTELDVLAAVALGLVGFVAVRLKGITSLLPRAEGSLRGQRLGMQTTDALLPQRHPIEEAFFASPQAKSKKP